MKKKSLPRFTGRNNLIVVAPHAANGKGNDDFVGTIARQIQSELGSYAIINDQYGREKVNFNSVKSIEAAELASEFLVPLKAFKNEIVQKGLQPLIVHIHGITDVNIRKNAKDGARILVGYGQGGEGEGERPHRKTLSEKDWIALRKHLRDAGLQSEQAPGGSNYCAWSRNNLSQLFNCADRRDFYDQKVRSVQLEIAMAGLRRSEKEAKATAKKLALALRGFTQQPEAYPVPIHPQATETEPDDRLVSETYEYLKGIVVRHFHKVMLEAGNYIIEKFFDGDYERAKNPRNAKKIHSFNELKSRLQGDDGHGPSKTWLYDSVKLAVDEQRLTAFSVYGKLGHSHKVRLTSVKDIEAKKALIQEAVANNYTVEQIRTRMAEIKLRGRTGKITLENLPPADALAKVDRDELVRLMREAHERLDFHKEKLSLYTRCVNTLKKAIGTLADNRNTPKRENIIEFKPEFESDDRERGDI